MKCSVCKNEFGTGEVCQHCGADKFTALANYSGYETSSNSHGAYNSGTISQSKMASVDSMVCHACGEIIPASSKFCPYCSCELLVICPKCGKSYSSQYPVCSECGTNREDYIRRKKEEHHIQEMKRWQARERQARELERQERERLQREKERQQQQEAQREAENIRSQLKYNATGLKIITWVIALLLGVFLTISSGEIAFVGFAASVSSIITLIILGYETNRSNERIRQWKREHPNHRAIPYLKNYSL